MGLNQSDLLLGLRGKKRVGGAGASDSLSSRRKCRKFLKTNVAARYARNSKITKKEKRKKFRDAEGLKLSPLYVRNDI